MFEVRYGRPERWKSVKSDDETWANGFYDRCIAYAKKHNLEWTVALFDRGWRVKSELVEKRLAPVK